MSRHTAPRVAIIASSIALLVVLGDAKQQAQQEAYRTYVDDDGMEVVEVVGDTEGTATELDAVEESTEELDMAGGSAEDHLELGKLGDLEQRFQTLKAAARKKGGK